MYPSEERAVAAHELVNTLRRTSGKDKLPLWSEQQLMMNSATEWIESNRDAYLQGLDAFELRQAKQFLFLHGDKKLFATKPIAVSCPVATEWARDISNDDLTYANQNTTVTRVGSVSCYPAAFAKLVNDHSIFRVSVDVAPRSSNWLTFGLARRGMATTSSDGVGRTSNTWGVADDRSSQSAPVVSGSGTTVGAFRKFVVGDVLSAEVDTAAGWCEVRLNESEFVHRFDIPVGTMADYCFAMTFANDHQVSIVTDAPTATSETSAGPSKAGELNAEHTRMYNSFKRQLKILIADPDDDLQLASNSPNRGANAGNVSPGSQPTTSALKTGVQEWVDICGGVTTAGNYFETIRPELQSMMRYGKEYPWKETSPLPWLTWKQLLSAASWFHENRLILKEAREEEMAYTFFLTHGADAPFMAAVNLSDFHTHKVDKADAQCSLAYMRFYAGEMQEWYDYDFQLREPMLENVAKGCRCLPRHTKVCPKCR